MELLALTDAAQNKTGIVVMTDFFALHLKEIALNQRYYKLEKKCLCFQGRFSPRIFDALGTYWGRNGDAMGTR